MLASMRRKQQLHGGDRSHPFIRKLDALTPTLSYDGWKDDARIIEWPGGDSLFEGLSMDKSGVDYVLARMRRKQAESGGDRTHKGLRKLDELKAVLSYDGWRRDADQAEEEHARYGRASEMLASMRRKQQLHGGDRSHPFIRKLDALTPTLSYDGWKDDARIIEWPGGDSLFEGLSMDKSGVDYVLARMRRKQAKWDGDRTHKDLRELDELVARLARGMQVPSASAPAPETPTSAALWNADTLPIQRLIEKVLAGKSCALSCLGLQPHLTHPKKTIRARFRVLAIRLHPDKTSHPQATEAFVKVRAAHDRLMANE